MRIIKCEIIIDRVEENGTAVLEMPDGTKLDIPLKLLPPGSQEGSVLFFENGSYRLDERAKQEREKKMQSLMDDLFE